MGRLLRAAQRRLPRGQAPGPGPGPLEVQPLPARLPGLHQGRRRERRPAARSSSTTRGWPSNTIVVYTVRPGLLPGRARLVRQALDLRGIAADAAPGPLAGRGEARQREPPSLVSNIDFAETFLDAAGAAGPRRDAGPQPRPAARGREPRATGEGASTTNITNTRSRTTSARTTAW